MDVFTTLSRNSFLDDSSRFTSYQGGQRLFELVSNLVPLLEQIFIETCKRLGSMHVRQDHAGC